MKTNIFFFTVLLLAFLSCSKDNDTDSLDGTVWVYTFTESGEVATLTFHAATFDLFEGKDDDGNPYSDSVSGSYTYNHPTITMTAEGDTNTGTRSENKIIFENEGIVFTKK